MKRTPTVARRAGILSCLVTRLILMGYEAPIISAQVLYGSIVGTVTDQTNSVVPKTVVKVTSPATGLVREVSTDSAGYYSIPNLPQGTYDLSVTASGFKPLTKKSVDVLINNVAHVDVSLEVGVVAESVTVEASGALLQTTKTDVNVNLESRAVEDLRFPTTATTKAC